MRTITITRNRITDNDSFFVVLDGETVGKMGSDVYKLEVDENSHEINTYSRGAHGEVYQIRAGDKDVTLDAKLSPDNTTYDLSLNSRGIIKPQNSHRQQNASEEKSLKLSVVSSVIIGLLVCVLALVMYSTHLTSEIGLLVGIIFAIGGSASMIFGGHWIIIIPLPFVYLWKTGCVKKNQSTSRKVLTAVLAIVLPIIGFLLMFLLSGI